MTWINPGPGSHRYCHTCARHVYAARTRPIGDKSTDGYRCHCLTCGSELEYLGNQLEPKKRE